MLKYTRVLSLDLSCSFWEVFSWASSLPGLFLKRLLGLHRQHFKEHHHCRCHALRIFSGPTNLHDHKLSSRSAGTIYFILLLFLSFNLTFDYTFIRHKVMNSVVSLLSCHPAILIPHLKGSGCLMKPPRNNSHASCSGPFFFIYLFSFNNAP